MQLNQMDDDFGVGLRGEGKPEPGESGAQCFVVLDNAVMHHREPAADMRVCIGL